MIEHDGARPFAFSGSLRTHVAGSKVIHGLHQPTGVTESSALPEAAQAAISGVLGRDDRSYHATRHGNGFHIENSKHGLSADFIEDGVQFHIDKTTWGLSLSGYGYGDRLQLIDRVEPVAEANRAEYRRGPVTEWYVNGPMGLEQGFTLSRPPEERGEGPLTVELKISGDLMASVAEEKDGLTLARQNGEVVLRYGGLSAFDAVGKRLDVWMQAQGEHILLHVNDSGSVYPVIVDPIVQRVKLTATDGGCEDSFGASVAISGDMIVVGAYQARSGADHNRGAAYVFVKSGDAWKTTETAKLIASDGAAGDCFGSSVAVSGDTVVVGAVFGVAYVFVKSGSSWTTMTQNAKLGAPNATASNFFGGPVAINGDTLVVGAPGAAYVFVRSENEWKTTEIAKLIASDGAAGDCFGSSVAVSGDTVVVGAYQAKIGNAPRQGAIYVFERSGSVWKTTETAKLIASDGKAGDYFGSSVAISGNILVVGAPWAKIGQYQTQGAAYVFVRSGNEWKTTETAKLIASDGRDFNYFGSSVAIRGDTVAIGAFVANIGDHQSQGTAYIFMRSGSRWKTTETAKLIAFDGAAGDHFGSSVAISEDTVVVGAGGATTGDHLRQGAAYLFAINNNPPIANAGSDLAVNEGTIIILDGSGSNDPDAGDVITYAWTQTSGPAVSLSGADTATPSFTAPEVLSDTILTFRLTVTDKSGSTSSDDVQVTVRNANKPPVGADKTVTTNEDTEYVFGIADLGFSDPDGDQLLAVRIATLPEAGSLVHDGIALAAAKSISAADIAAGKLVFRPAPNANGTGYARFAFQVQDDGGTANGAVDLDPTPRIMTIDVTPQNDAPAITRIPDQSVTMNTAAHPSKTPPIPFAVRDIDTVFTESNRITVRAATDLVPPGGIQLQYVGIDPADPANYLWTVTLTPARDLSGSVSISVTASDGTSSATRRFTLYVK